MKYRTFTLCIDFLSISSETPTSSQLTRLSFGEACCENTNFLMFSFLLLIILTTHMNGGLISAAEASELNLNVMKWGTLHLRSFLLRTLQKMYFGFSPGLSLRCFSLSAHVIETQRWMIDLAGIWSNFMKTFTHIHNPESHDQLSII